MAAGRARVLALSAALLLAAASAWWLGSRAGGWSDPAERGLEERADTHPLAAAVPSPASAPHLEGRGGRAASLGGDEEEGIPLTVTVTGSDGGPGEARVDAGRDDASLEYGDRVRFGEPAEVFVPVGTRVVRVEGKGATAALYEPVDVRHDPARGPIAVRLERGAVSIHARVVDEQDRPLRGVSLFLSQIWVLNAGVLERTTDGKGEAHWEGLVRAVSALPDVFVQSWTGPEGIDAGGRAEIVWDASRTRGSVALVLHHTGMRVTAPATHMERGWFLERLDADGTWTFEGWPGRLVQESPGTFLSAGLLRGAYRITFLAADGSHRRAEFDLVNGTIASVETLQPSDVERVPGRITGPGGVNPTYRLLRIVGPEAIVKRHQGDMWLIPVAEDGTFVLHRPEWLTSVRFALPLVMGVYLVPSGATLGPGARLELATVLGVKARGIVRDARGEPVVGASVRARARTANPNARDVAHPEWFDEKTNGVRTDAGGRFEALIGPPGSWTFTVHRMGKPVWESPEAVPIPGTDEVILTVP
jgi:hypothetical protein